jgi:hypothetical protein
MQPSSELLTSLALLLQAQVVVYDKVADMPQGMVPVTYSHTISTEVIPQPVSYSIPNAPECWYRGFLMLVN